MSEPITGEALYHWREWAIQLAKTNHIDPYEVDWLLQGLTPLTQLSLQTESYKDQPNIPCKFSLSQLTEKWQQRVTDKVPVQYLVGETPWRNFSITVTPDVLIPRPETELIIDIAKTLANQSPMVKQLLSGNWADVGTGSGAIAIGLAHTFPQAKIHATDISSQALKIAKRNAAKNNLTDRITFHQGNWLTPLISLKGHLAAIVTNPPYIPTATVPTLQPEVNNHEPHLALDGGPDGLDYLRTLIEDGIAYLKPGGLLLTELMAGQAQTVANLLKQQDSYSKISTHKDLSGIERFVSACKAL